MRPVRATEDGYAFLAPVGSYPDGASRFGVLDLAGNVAEWVEDEAYVSDHRHAQRLRGLLQIADKWEDAG